MECPCCKQAVDPTEHPGLVINRMAYLRSQVITLEEICARGALPKEKPSETFNRIANVIAIKKQHKDELVQLAMLVR